MTQDITSVVVDLDEVPLHRLIEDCGDDPVLIHALRRVRERAECTSADTVAAFNNWV